MASENGETEASQVASIQPWALIAPLFVREHKPVQLFLGATPFRQVLGHQIDKAFVVLLLNQVQELRKAAELS
jgi:hypothetical protein